jgi:hypothetical protein
MFLIQKEASSPVSQRELRFYPLLSYA